MNKRIAILIGFSPNPRIYKRLELEKTLGEIYLICWDRGSNMLPPPVERGFQAHTIKIDAGSDPLKRIRAYLKFAKEATRLLEEIKPDLIHVQGLDMLKIACSYKKKSPKDVKIIYEVADLHRLLVDQQKSLMRKAAQKYLIYQDRAQVKNYDLLIITSMKYYETYFKDFVPEDKMLYIPNVPNLAVFQNYKKKRGTHPFVAGYIGGIRYKKEIRNLITAAKACGIELMIAGYENEPLEIEPLCKSDSDIEWIGRFDFDTQAASLYEKCDVMYSVYDADMRNVRVALPNKLYEAVYCEMPLIVAKNTYLAQVVQEWGVGVAVDHRQPEDLIEALKRLRDDEAYYRSLCENCRKHKTDIDLERYNEQLKQRLRPLLESGH